MTYGWIPALLLVACVAGLRLNVTPSIPYGFYWESSRPDAISYGMLVVFRLEGGMLRLVKPVVGLPGDETCHVGGLLIIRGVSYGPMDPDVPPWHEEGGCAPVPPGTVFLASLQPRSYDSRYFGPVPVSRLAGVVTPLWTWGSGMAGQRP